MRRAIAMYVVGVLMVGFAVGAIAFLVRQGGVS